jgi:hypothetical protein
LQSLKPFPQFSSVIAPAEDEDTKNVNLLGYLSHVQGQLKLKAQKEGCNMVLPRSAFSQN